MRAGAAGSILGLMSRPDSRTGIRKMFEAAGLGIACIMGYTRFTWDEPEKRAESVATAIKLVEVAHDVGCPTLRIFGGIMSEKAPFEENLQRVIESVRRITPAAGKLGVKLGGKRRTMTGAGAPTLRR